MITRTFVRELCLASTITFASALPALAQCPAWSTAVGQNGPDNSVLAMTVLDDGTGPALYAGGIFGSVGGTPARYVAKWDGSSWSPLGTGLELFVLVLAAFDDGSGPALYAGCNYSPGHGDVTIARWDGSTWSTLGFGLNSSVRALAVFDDGFGPALYAGGDFTMAGPIGVSHVAKWDGSTWSPLGSGTDGVVRALCVYDDGSGPALFVGGNFTQAGSVNTSGIAKWNGSSWSALAGVVSAGIVSMAVFDDGTGATLAITGGVNAGAGNFNIGRWNGSSWFPMSSPPPASSAVALAAFDDGTGTTLIASGNHNWTGRWNGSGWTYFGGVGPANNLIVSSFCVFDDGLGPALYFGGGFTTPAPYIAAWRACNHAGAKICSGDGSAVACPCANNGAPGHGCENSAASGGAVLSSSGWTSVTYDSLVLTSSGELASVLSVFLQGSAQIAPVSFGDGLRCAGGSLKRLYTKNASGGTVVAPLPGDDRVTARSAALGDVIQVGEARIYQVYYRDPDLTFCAPPNGDAWNVSSGLRIGWLP